MHHFRAYYASIEIMNKIKINKKYQHDYIGHHYGLYSMYPLKNCQQVECDRDAVVQWDIALWNNKLYDEKLLGCIVKEQHISQPTVIISWKKKDQNSPHLSGYCEKHTRYLEQCQIVLSEQDYFIFSSF